MTRRLSPVLALMMSGLSLASCANTQQLRDASTALSAYAAKREAATQAAIERYDELNRDLARIDEGRRRRAEIMAGAAAVQTRAWGLVEDKTRLRYAAEGMRVTPETLAAAPAAVAPIAPLDPGVFKADFGKAVKAATKLGKTPSLKERATAAIKIIKGVNDGVDDLAEKAAADTDADAAKTQAAAKGVDKAAGLTTVEAPKPAAATK